ncbi:MAG TPA: N-methyl-L-tryptophan oxidase [Lacipirellula sp.]
MPHASYDAIVLGAGGVGSAAMWQLARRGLRVLGIDRFHPPHDRGSSHGHTRIIRQAYFEHADYVPLLLESYRLWEELEHLAGKELKRETGLVEIGPPDGVVVPGVLQAAALHGLDVQRLTAEEIKRRWPALRPPADSVGVFERRAGLLSVERCVEACLNAARAAGAELLAGVEALGWAASDDIVVQTSAGEFRAEKLVITAGAWAGQVLSALNVKFQVRRIPLSWYAPTDSSTHADAGFPCYLFELPHGIFYGFPAIDQRGVKAAEHSGGDVIADPLHVDRGLTAEDQAPVDAFMQRHLPAVRTPCIEHAVCLYTMSPDEHFVVDRHPADERVVFAAGLSGHGFKFTPILGRLLTELVVDGRTTLPAGFLSLARFAR